MHLHGLLFSVLKLRLRLKQLDLLIAATLGGSGGGSSNLRLQNDFDFVRVDPFLTENYRSLVVNKQWFRMCLISEN